MDDDDLGAISMERFKKQCRLILGPGSKSHRHSNIGASMREFEDEFDMDGTFLS